MLISWLPPCPGDRARTTKLPPRQWVSPGASLKAVVPFSPQSWLRGLDDARAPPAAIGSALLSPHSPPPALAGEWSRGGLVQLPTHLSLLLPSLSDPHREVRMLLLLWGRAGSQPGRFRQALSCCGSSICFLRLVQPLQGVEARLWSSSPAVSFPRQFVSATLLLPALH